MTENKPLYVIDIDKKNLSIKEISFESATDKLKNKVIVLIDDVMNSASTLMYSINEILKIFAFIEIIKLGRF